GWCLSPSYAVTGAIEALNIALSNNKIIASIMHHSDRGIQYCCKEYTSILINKKAVISMTENSDPYENAIAERVNGILKTELLSKNKTYNHQFMFRITIHIRKKYCKPILGRYKCMHKKQKSF